MNYEYIDRPDELARVVQRLTEQPLLGVDTEAAGYHRYLDRLSLLQISTREVNLLIDPLALDDLSPLRPLLADRNTEKIFHDADFDLRILHRDLGVVVGGLFDTQIAAAFLGERSLGLGAIVERALKKDAHERYPSARSMWVEIEAFRSGELVESYAYSSWELLARFFSRNRSTVGVALIGLFALLVTAIASYQRITDSRDQALDAERRMRGRDDHPAAPKVRVCHRRKHRLSFGVERGERFVEQPQRPRRDQEPRKRQPPLLAGREHAGRQVGQAIESERGERRYSVGPSTEQRTHEIEILFGRERGLYAVEMADEMDRRLRRLPLQSDAAIGGPQQSGNQSQ